MFKEMFESIKSKCDTKAVVFSLRVMIDRMSFKLADIEVIEWSSDDVVMYEAVYRDCDNTMSRFSFEIREALAFTDTWIINSKCRLFCSTATRWNDDDDEL